MYVKNSNKNFFRVIALFLSRVNTCNIRNNHETNVYKFVLSKSVTR